MYLRSKRCRLPLRPIAAENDNQQEAPPPPPSKKTKRVRFQLPPPPENSESESSPSDEEPKPINQPSRVQHAGSPESSPSSSESSSEGVQQQDQGNHESDYLSDEDPAPGGKPQNILEFSSESDDDDTTNADESSNAGDEANQQARVLQDNAEEETNSNPMINLRCLKSIMASYPKQLHPPFSFRLSSDMLAEFMRMSKDEKWAARKAFSALSIKEKANVKSAIPGSNCSCCAPVTRSDKGKQRGKNARTKRQSRRLQGDDPSSPHQQGGSTSTHSPATSARSPATPARSPATSARSVSAPPVVYNSMAHGEAARDAAPGEEKPRYKRQSKKGMEYARSVQMQGGETAMQEIITAQHAMIDALTFSTREPKFDETSGTYKYDQRTEIPRVRGLMIFVNEVGETPMCGGKLPDGKLRREKPQISYVGACKEDVAYVWDAMSDAQDNPEKYEKVRFMGTGVLAHQRFADYTKSRKLARSKFGQQAQSIQESQASIPDDVAPSMV
jgi:hypothetical protein